MKISIIAIEILNNQDKCYTKFVLSGAFCFVLVNEKNNVKKINLQKIINHKKFIIIL